MRTLSTFATLIVGLAFVSFAPSVKADCPHNGRTDHPHCDVGDPGGTTDVLVLRDGNGEIIGEVAHFDDNTVQVVYRGDPADALFFEDYPLAILWLSVLCQFEFCPETPDPYWLSEPSVFFESSDCSVLPYYQNAANLIPFNLPYRLNVREVSGGGQIIYVPSDITETPALVTVNSGLSANSFCQQISPPQERLLTTATTVIENFVGPYSVGF